MANIALSWGNYNEDEQKKDQKVAAEASGNNFWKPKEGRNRIRVLPPKPGASSIYRVVWQHFPKNAKDESKSFNCPRKTDKQNLPCPCCDAEQQLASTGSQVDKTASRNFKAKIRVYANIIDLDNEDDGVQVFGFGTSIHNDLIGIGEERSFWDPNRGCEIIVKRKGSGVNTEYTVLPGSDHAISAAQAEYLIKGMHDLKMVAGGCPNAQEIREMLEELGLDGDLEEEPPRRVQTRALPRGNERRASARDAQTVDGELEEDPFGDRS